MNNVTEIRRFAIKYKPPTLIVIYKKEDEKTYMKKIRFQETYLNNVNAKDLTMKLIKRHDDILYPLKVCSEQLEDLVSLLIQGYNENNDGITNNNEIDEYNNRKNAHDLISIKYGDLNKLSDEEVNKAKREMDSDFEMNRVKPGDEDFIYDKQISFDAPIESSEWDVDEDF